MNPAANEAHGLGANVEKNKIFDSEDEKKDFLDELQAFVVPLPAEGVK